MDAVLLVGIGGAIGAVLRYVVYVLVDRAEFPAATIVVNALGSFVLGLVVFSASDAGWFLFVGVGICGAFTTYSTFSFETVRLWQQRMRGYAVLSAVGNLACSLLAVGCAWLLV